jgi:23S rRNA-/tRNA-specific pseudouridylate synthase
MVAKINQWLAAGWLSASLISLPMIQLVTSWSTSSNCGLTQPRRRIQHAVVPSYWNSAGLSLVVATDTRLRCDYQRTARVRLDSRLHHAATLQEDLDLELDTTTTEETNVDDSYCPESYESMPEGLPRGFYIVKEHSFTPDNISIDLQDLDLDPNHVDRLELNPNNVTLPIALMMLDAEEYPSLSRARKFCRKGNVLIQRRTAAFEQKKIGRVGDRVYPGDVICKQVRMGDGYFAALGHKQPPFELPVIYEDDHFALVNKPAGVVVYRQGAGQLGLMSVRAALPFVLTPPKRGTYSVMRRPASVHRLDKPTSGLLCVVKTKPAMLSMSRQFHDRIVKKTYMAIVHGIPEERSEASITAQEAVQLGVDIDLNNGDPPDTRWQLIDSPLDEKSAVTVWRAVQYVPSLHALDGYLTLVELKPKTGRYHQLRRHLAWNCRRAIVGDAEYDGGSPEARKYRERGLFLCASRVSHEHPYFNSPEGRVEWNRLDDEQKFADGILWLSDDDTVMVSANVDLPDKFNSLLAREEERFLKFQTPAQ